MKLYNGLSIPEIGLGTWKSRAKDIAEILPAALDIGYRHIDTAAVYENEAKIGEILKTYMKSKGLKREEFFIASKLWGTYFKPEDVSVALQDDLDKLQTDYLDLYLMHWPVPLIRVRGLISKKSAKNGWIADNVKLSDTWKAMEALVRNGKLKSIGVSNFQIHHLNEILENCEIKPAVNQVECHPYLPQKELLEFCRKHEIHVTAYSPLGSGQSPNLLEDEVVVQIAKEIGCTPAQVLINFHTKRGLSVIPKTSKVSRLEENFKKIELNDHQISLLESRNIKHRFIDPKVFADYNVFNE